MFEGMTASMMCFLTLYQLVCHLDGQGHELRSLIAGVAEHQPLIAGAAGIDAHGDIGRLRLDQVVHAAGVAVEPVAGIVIADIFNGAARQPGNVQMRRCGDLARHDAGTRGYEGLACHAAGRVLCHYSIEHGV